MTMNQNTETKIVLPFPHRPQDVRNLGWVDWVEALGFRGPDASLEESLFEYGLAWLVLPDQNVCFIHRHSSSPDVFDRTVLIRSNPILEWDWVDWVDFFAAHGTTEDEWRDLPFPKQVQNLVIQHGPENIFGTSYWEGFGVQPGGPGPEQEVRLALELIERPEHATRMNDPQDAASLARYSLDVARRALQEVRQFNENNS